MDQEPKDTKETENQTKENAVYPLMRVRGLPLPKLLLDEEAIEKLMDMRPDPTDIFVVTYPKCGTTWAQYIVWLILNKGESPPSPNQMMFKNFRFLEFIGIDDLDSLPRPRTMKTHLPFNLQPYHPLAKYIYVVRNPWDCCVSYYYHQKLDKSLPSISFDRHFELFIEGQVPWGDFFDHVLSWHEHRNDPNILFLSYEEMKRDPKCALFTIAKFLGAEYHAALEADISIVERCLNYSSFKYLKEMGFFTVKLEKFADLMKKNDPINMKSEYFNQMANVDKNNVDLNSYEEFEFFRKGVIGDWRNHFNSKQVKLFNEYMINKLKDTKMNGFWEPLMEETSV